MAQQKDLSNDITNTEPKDLAVETDTCSTGHQSQNLNEDPDCFGNEKQFTNIDISQLSDTSSMCSCCDENRHISYQAQSQNHNNAAHLEERTRLNKHYMSEERMTREREKKHIFSEENPVLNIKVESSFDINDSPTECSDQCYVTCSSHNIDNSDTENNKTTHSEGISSPTQKKPRKGKSTKTKNQNIEMTCTPGTSSNGVMCTQTEIQDGFMSPDTCLLEMDDIKVENTEDGTIHYINPEGNSLKTKGRKALSPVERQRRYRKKRDEDPTRRQQYLQFERQRYHTNKERKTTFNEMTEEFKNTKRFYWRVNKANSRKRTKNTDCDYKRKDKVQLTSAEKQRRYREKRDQNLVRRQEYLEKERLRYKANKQSNKILTIDQKNVQRQKWRLLKATCNSRKLKIELQNSDTIVDKIAVSSLEKQKCFHASPEYKANEASKKGQMILDELIEQFKTEPMEMSNTSNANITCSRQTRNIHDCGKMVKKRPLTSLERQRRFREKRNKDIVKRQEYLEKERVRHQTSRNAFKHIASEISEESKSLMQVKRKKVKQEITHCDTKKDKRRLIAAERQRRSREKRNDDSFRQGDYLETEKIGHKAGRNRTQIESANSEESNSLLQIKLSFSKAKRKKLKEEFTNCDNKKVKKTLSPAERQRRFREKRNKDIVRRQEYLEKERLRHIEDKKKNIQKFSNISDESKNLQRQKWRLSKANSRKRKNNIHNGKCEKPDCETTSLNIQIDKNEENDLLNQENNS